MRADLASHACAALADNAVFQLLFARAGAEASIRFRLVDHERGQVCLYRGETCLMFLSSGLVKTTRLSHDGRALTLDVLGPGDTLGAASLVGSEGSLEDHVVMQGGAALRLDVPWVRQIMREEPATSIALSKELARRLRQTQHRAARLKNAAAPALVADWLLGLAALTPSRSQLWQQADLFTQEEMAEQIGVSRETVNQSLRSFVLRGWLRREGGSWLILDREALEMMAGHRSIKRVAS